jgi:hypothetical protein
MVRFHRRTAQGYAKLVTRPCHVLAASLLLRSTTADAGNARQPAVRPASYAHCDADTRAQPAHSMASIRLRLAASGLHLGNDPAFLVHEAVLRGKRPLTSRRSRGGSGWPRRTFVASLW